MQYVLTKLFKCLLIDKWIDQQVPYKMRELYLRNLFLAESVRSMLTCILLTQFVLKL